MPKSKPYRFSKRLGRYVSKSKKGNRQYYFQKLKSLHPEVSFDPDSTFGKFAMKKLTPSLRGIRHYSEKWNEDWIQSAIKSKSELEDSNKKTFEIRKTKELESIAELLLKKRHAVLGKIIFAIRSIDKSAIVNLVEFILVLRLAIGIINGKNIFDPKLLLPFLALPPFYLAKYCSNWMLRRLLPDFLIEAEKELSIEKLMADLEQSVRKAEREIERRKQKVQRDRNAYTMARQKVCDILNELNGESYVKFVLSDGFYASTDWRRLRDTVFSEHEPICKKCGSRENLAVDHIRPRSKYPLLALEKSNLQILCRNCNSAKGTKHE